MIISTDRDINSFSFPKYERNKIHGIFQKIKDDHGFTLRNGVDFALEVKQTIAEIGTKWCFPPSNSISSIICVSTNTKIS